MPKWNPYVCIILTYCSLIFIIGLTIRQVYIHDDTITFNTKYFVSGHPVKLAGYNIITEGSYMCWCVLYAMNGCTHSLLMDVVKPWITHEIQSPMSRALKYSIRKGILIVISYHICCWVTLIMVVNGVTSHIMFPVSWLIGYLLYSISINFIYMTEIISTYANNNMDILEANRINNPNNEYEMQPNQNELLNDERIV